MPYMIRAQFPLPCPSLSLDGFADRRGYLNYPAMIFYDRGKKKICIYATGLTPIAGYISNLPCAEKIFTAVEISGLECESLQEEMSSLWIDTILPHPRKYIAIWAVGLFE